MRIILTRTGPHKIMGLIVIYALFVPTQPPKKKHASSTFIFMPIGSLRSYDGFCNENVTYNRTVLPLFHVGHVVQNRRSVLSLAWHEWFSSRAITGLLWLLFSCKGRE